MVFSMPYVRPHYGGEGKHMTFKVSLKQSKQPGPIPSNTCSITEMYTDIEYN